MRQTTGGRRPRGRPNRKQHLPLRNQTFDSNGPEVRVRGNAHQVYEKYLALARDATSSGDRVAAEGFYQFAEHYFRIVNSSTDPERAQPDGQGGRRDRQGAPSEGGERPVEAGAQPPPASLPTAEQPPTVQPEATPGEGNGADSSDSPPPPTSPEGEEQEKTTAKSGSSRRRSSRRPKRDTANGSNAESDAPAGEEPSEGDDAEPVTA